MSVGSWEACEIMRGSVGLRETVWDVWSREIKRGHVRSREAMWKNTKPSGIKRDHVKPRETMFNQERPFGIDRGYVESTAAQWNQDRPCRVESWKTMWINCGSERSCGITKGHVELWESLWDLERPCVISEPCWAYRASVWRSEAMWNPVSRGDSVKAICDPVADSFCTVLSQITVQVLEFSTNWLLKEMFNKFKEGSKIT
jgi:hypothetical protein